MKTYELELEKAKSAAKFLRAYFLEKLLNQPVKGWSCCCGAIKHGDGKVVDVSIPSKYEYQIPLWFIWSVNIKDDDRNDKPYNWSCGLSDFFGVEEIEKLFDDYFKDVDAKFLEEEEFKSRRYE